MFLYYLQTGTYKRKGFHTHPLYHHNPIKKVSAMSVTETRTHISNFVTNVTILLYNKASLRYLFSSFAESTLFFKETFNKGVKYSVAETYLSLIY